MRNFPRLFLTMGLFLLFLFLPSCFHSQKNNANSKADSRDNLGAAETGGAFVVQLIAVMLNAELPDTLSPKILAASARNSAFMTDLSACLAQDRHLWELVDKQHSLPPDYVPSDLVTLTNGHYQVSRAGLMLRRDAAESLGEMAAAARSGGITLVASSAYRSYRYQEEVYNRNVREMGQEAADRESARPGYSQHQTGLVLDFGSIDDSFAQTAAGRWIAANAARFGWSLSFPNGYEAVTGYRWESWHYRYVGREIAAFINNYFDGIQQYALRFMYEYELYTKNH
ncbi:MAG: M15 family metallopeptidase [Treponema sp.]|nr:M15 family metallopeptidase [Treponema sp.]